MKTYGMWVSVCTSAQVPQIMGGQPFEVWLGNFRYGHASQRDGNVVRMQEMLKHWLLWRNQELNFRKVAPLLEEERKTQKEKK